MFTARQHRHPLVNCTVHDFLPAHFFCAERKCELPNQPVFPLSPARTIEEKAYAPIGTLVVANVQVAIP
eukprot:2183105-Pyramimonas_sp.AAC.1